MLQQHANQEEIPTLQNRIQETLAAKEAHLLLAQTTLNHMNQQIAHSKKQYTLIQKYRKKMIFGETREIRRVYKAMWLILLTKTKFILIADYQMVITNQFTSHLFSLSLLTPPPPLPSFISYPPIFQKFCISLLLT